MPKKSKKPARNILIVSEMDNTCEMNRIEKILKARLKLKLEENKIEQSLEIFKNTFKELFHDYPRIDSFKSKFGTVSWSTRALHDLNQEKLVANMVKAGLKVDVATKIIKDSTEHGESAPSYTFRPPTIIDAGLAE